MPIKLDKTDKEILTELDKNCRISSNVLAKKVKKSRQTVDYRINKLVEEGIITSFNAAINPHKIGYKLYKIYLKLRNIEGEKEELFKHLKSSGTVYWMGECAGRWDLIFAMFARNDQEFFRMKNELISEFNSIIVDEEGQILVEVKQYPKMYFTNEIQKPTMFAGELKNDELDEKDHLLLSEIVNNGRISIVDLAEKINTTVSIAQGKLKKLVDKGVIIQFRIGVDLAKLGYELYKAIIKIDRYTEEDHRNMLNYVSSIANVQYFITNIWSLEPEFVVNNFQEYHNIIEKLKKKFPNVIRTVDSVLMITDDWTPGFKNLIK